MNPLKPLGTASPKVPSARGGIGPPPGLPPTLLPGLAQSCLTLNNSNNNRGSSRPHTVLGTVLVSEDSGVSRVPSISLRSLPANEAGTIYTHVTDEQAGKGMDIAQDPRRGHWSIQGSLWTVTHLGLAKGIGKSTLGLPPSGGGVLSFPVEGAG